MVVQDLILTSSKKVIDFFDVCVSIYDYNSVIWYVHVFLYTASQMKTLVRLLPLSIGGYVPEEDEHWSCFLIFWEICNRSLAFEVTKEDAGHLSWLAEAFLESFTSLYSLDSVTPKMHQMVHFPEQVLR